MKEYDALVLGSGVGGLASALLMAHAGKKVAVFEKLPHAGGRLTGSKRPNGFTVDYGVHLISCGAKGPLIELLDRCETGESVEFVSVRPVQSTGGEIFKFPRDLKGRIPDCEFDAIMKMVMGFKDMDEEGFRAIDDISLKEYLDELGVHDTFAHACLSMIGVIYCCTPEFMISAGEFGRCMHWEAQAHSSGYPLGGCGSIINAYLNGLKKYGADVYMKTPVDKIIVEDGKAVGIVANGEEYRAEIIASNLGYAETIRDYVGAEYFDKPFLSYVDGLKRNYASIIARFGVDTVINPDIKMLSQFCPIDPYEYEQRLVQGNPPDEVSGFVVVPSAFDPSVAPEGTQLIVMAGVIPIDASPEAADAAYEKMVRGYEKYFPGLSDHIIFQDKVLPADSAAVLGEMGSGIGIAQNVGQTGAKRPPIKTPMPGLYIVGAEAGGAGVGTEMAARSAIEFFENYVA